MSRYFNSFMDDSSEALEHSWGTSPEAKAREKEYNQKHKAEIEAIRKQRSAATNSYKQAAKSHNDAVRYQGLSDQIDARLHGWKTGPRTKTSDGSGYSRTVKPIYELGGYNRVLGESASAPYGGSIAYLTKSANSRLENAKTTYQNKAYESSRRSDKLTSQGDRQKASAKTKAEKILRGLKNPTAKDLAEFYLDTTVVKAKKSASKAAKKAEKYATKAVSNAEKYATNKDKKYATKAVSNAEKYATKAVSNAEKATNKAKKYVVR